MPDNRIIIGLGSFLVLLVFGIALLLMKPEHFKREAYVMIFMYVLFPTLFFLIVILSAFFKLNPR
jgi:hypothetical protein